MYQTQQFPGDNIKKLAWYIEGLLNEEKVETLSSLNLRNIISSNCTSFTGLLFLFKIGQTMIWSRP